MNKTRLLTLLVLLMTAASGAWATDPTTHVVTNANVNSIFSGDGYTLSDAVAVGDELNFQGTIDIEHSLVINKRVTITGSSNPVVKLNTESGSLMGEDPGNSFVINKAGSGTTVQGIRFENSEVWIFNTSNVTFTGVTFHVEDVPVGSGVGHVAIRYSDHVTFDGCTVYTKDNGGSSACALTGSSNCTFKDTRFESIASVGNPLFLCNTTSVQDKPSDFVMACNDCQVLNCTFTKDVATSTCIFAVGGLRHRIEGCTIENMNVTSGFNATMPTSAADGHIYRNNTVMGGNLTVHAFSTAEGNTVTGNVTIGKGTTITNNNITGNVTINYNSSDYPGSTITGNSILGKVTFGSNSKNNTFTGNTVISSEAYAVVMATTANANNTVTDNILLAKEKAGDAAIDPKTGTGNTLTPNQAEATCGDATWTFDAATGTLTIGGTGAMANYDQTTDGHSTAPWAFISDKITRVVIGEGVTKVGNNAFYGCTALNDVFAKGTNTPTIGSNAFDTNATFNIYVPSGKETAYKLAWSDYADYIREFMSCGDNTMAIYDADTKTLTICGSGAMTDFASAADQPWASLQGELQQVVFEATITNIGTNAFANCSALTTANILGTATTIADGAFNGNATSRRILVPVSAIGNYGESSHAADIYAIGLCGAEGSDITWELNAKTMALSISGTGAMADFANTSNVPWYSVRDKITSATIGSGITTIGSYAFNLCSSLATVSLPEGLTTIGKNAFSGCSALTTVDIPDGVTSIGVYAFKNCSKLATINIPAGVTTIGEETFYGCSLLENIIIPAGVTIIDFNAFRNCSSLATVNIPAGVTSIGQRAFQGCTGLTSVIIPESVETISYNAFLDCSNLAEVYIFAPSLQTYVNNAFNNNASGRKIYVPADAVDTYKAGWPAYAAYIEAMPITDVTLTDGQGITAFDNLKGKPGAVTYQRSFTSGTASTVCLPFAYVKKTGEAFYTFSGITKNGDEYVADMTEVTSAALTANKPYLFMPSATGDTDFSGTYAIPATLEAGSVTKGDWTFQGTYETIEWTTAPTGIYGFSGQAVDGISQGQFVKVGAYVRISPMRCYLKYKNGSADYAGARSENGTNDEVLPETIKVRLISANGTVTAIGSLSTKTGEVTLDNDAWYSLDGRRVVTPTKGVYIKNGKKVVIK